MKQLKVLRLLWLKYKTLKYRFLKWFVKTAIGSRMWRWKTAYNLRTVLKVFAVLENYMYNNNVPRHQRRNFWRKMTYNSNYRFNYIQELLKSLQQPKKHK